MASSQFYSVCLAQESIRACRALLLASQCPSSRPLLHPPAMAAMALKLRFSRSSFQSSSCHGSHGFSCFSYRAFASVSSSPRTRRAIDIKNPREEIRKLDEEIHRLERERRSVGKGKNAGMGGKAVSDGRNRNAAGYAPKERMNAKLARSNRSSKFGAESGSSRNANARAMSRYAQEEEEEEEEDDDGNMVDDDSDDDNDIADEDDEELGEDFSSDAEMYMETTDAEKESKMEAPDSASLVSEKPSSVTTESSIVDPIEAAVPNPEAPKDDVSTKGVQCTKHPWKEWNDFYDVLAQKNYFKDVPPSKTSMEGEGYLRFQASAHMKRAILEFSRERDDIIRFLTKKHIRTVVNVGCPSTDRKVVNACKRLRVLCEIPEDEVCQQCKLKTFCTRAFAAPSPDLVAETSDVARVVYSFALNASPNAESQVSYPVGVVKSVCHLIDEIVQLSAYPKDPGLPALKSRNPVKPPVIKKDDADGHHRPGDWTCPDCNFLNFSKNKECRECGTFRESAKQLEPGDWECPECTFVNFRRNRECRECLSPRPPGMGGEIGGGGDSSMMPGDWKCPECQFKNFRRNSSCRKCSAKRPKDLEPNDSEDYEPGDWKCPECNFRNFQRNKNCKECGALSPDQNRKDDRWGLKKASGTASDGWGSNRSVQAAEKEGNMATGSGRTKHQEWKPDLNKEMSDDSDEDLEENADVVFRRYEDDMDMPRQQSKGLSKGTKGSSSSRRNDADEMSLSDFGISDLDDDFPKKSQKRGSKKAGKDADEDEEDDEDDDDNDMIDELSENEETTSLAASKRATQAAKGRSFAKTWDDTASDDEDLSDDDRISTPRTAVKRPLPKSQTFSKRWDDSDDDDDDEDEGFSDDEDDFGRSRGRGRGRGSSSRGGLRGGRDGGGNRGWRGSARGSHRGESFGSFGGGDRGRHSSNFLESSGDEEEFSSRRGGGRGGRGLTRGGGRGDRGRHGSNFLDSSGDEEDFSSRRGGGRGGRGLMRGGGGGDRGRRGSRFLDSSGDEEEFSRGGGGRGGRGFRRGGGGRGGGGGGFLGGGESFSRGNGRNRFGEGSRGGYESGRGRSFEGGRGSFGSRGRGGGRRGRS